MNWPHSALFIAISALFSSSALADTITATCGSLTAAAATGQAVSRPAQPQPYCQAQPDEGYSLKLAPPIPGKAEPITVNADESDGVSEDFLQIKKNVDLRTPSRQVLADWMRYDIPLDTIRARGDVVLRTWQDLVKGPELEYKRDTATGYMKSPQYVLGQHRARGQADELHFTGPQRYQVINGTYSTCVDPTPAWRLEVSQLDIDQNASVGTARNAKLYIGSLPVAWFPHFSFPLDNNRKSGVLTPTYGTSANRGFDLQVPYYFNLAPNYDATLTTRLMTKRGLLFNGETRYLFDTPFGQASGIWTAELMPNDRLADGMRRNATAMRHTQLFSPNLSLQLNYNYVSDPRYFADLADYVGVTSITTLPRDATLTYSNWDWIFTAKAQRYQTLQDPNAIVIPPYNRLPQLNAQSPVYRFGANNRFEAQTVADVTQFEFPTASHPSGSRAYNYSTLAWRYETAGGFVIPKVGLHATQYRLKEEFDDYRNSTRVLPITSIDTGLHFERDTSLFGKSFLQTLEPRAMFTYIPYRNQSETPIFDTALADFNQLQLFSENRYIGQDRIGDTRQLALGLTTRFYDTDTQKERLRITLGERFYFNNQRVSIGEPLRDRNSSDLLLSATGRITDKLFVEANSQFNADMGQAERYSFGLRYSPEPTKNFNINYRAIRELITLSGPVRVKQIDVSAQWPIYRNIYAVGRLNYSLADSRLTEGLVGFEYDGCCYVVRAVAQRLATSTTTVTNAFFLQLELNGLGRIGSNPLDLLRRSIPGYSALYSNPARYSVYDDSTNHSLFTPWTSSTQ